MALLGGAQANFGRTAITLAGEKRLLERLPLLQRTLEVNHLQSLRTAGVDLAGYLTRKRPWSTSGSYCPVGVTAQVCNFNNHPYGS